MVKFKIISTVCILSMLISLLVLLFDFNQYSHKSKAGKINDNSNIFFSITSFDGKNESSMFTKSLGHAWVSIDNQSGHVIHLKDYEIADNELLTFSVWAITNHQGVAFNLEAEFASNFDRYNGCVSLTVPIKESDLQTIENYIASYDNWTFNRNCSHWSLDLWNEIVDDEYQLKKQTLMYTPKRVKKSIEEYQNVEYDKDFSRSKKCFIYVDGERTELSLCE